MGSTVRPIALALTAAAVAVLPLFSQSPAPSPSLSPPSSATQPPAAGDEITVRVIVVPSAEAAERIAERLRNGANFIALANAESTDPTGDAGGMLGKVSLSTLPPLLR